MRIADIDSFFYCSPDHLDKHRPISEPDDIAELDFVEYVRNGSVSERYRVLDELVSKLKRGFISTSVLAQLKPTRQAWESGFSRFTSPRPIPRW